MTEQIKVIDKRRLLKYIAKLPTKYIYNVNTAMKIAVGLQERNSNGIYR